MDWTTFEIPVFLIATFVGAFVAGLSGFAFGLVAASLWLYILSPLQSATLIVAFGLIVQGYSVWKLRNALDWQKLWPFIVGAALGVPAGVTLLTWSDPRNVRLAVGIVLVLYSLYAFFRPALKYSGGGQASDGAIGFLNGLLGGLSGLAGILVTIWCNLRGWPKDVQRTVFQPVAVAIFLMSAAWLGAKGAVTADTIKFFVIGLPCLFAGTWLGLELFGRIDEATFRKIVLALKETTVNGTRLARRRGLGGHVIARRTARHGLHVPPKCIFIKLRHPRRIVVRHFKLDNRIFAHNKTSLHLNCTAGLYMWLPII